MEAKIIETGKYKGLRLSECPTSYILWASRHENNFLESHKWVSRNAKAMLAPVVAPVIVETVVETPAPRATRFDRHLCCEVFADTGERVTPQIFIEGLGWVSPPGAEEVLSVEAGLPWSYAVRRSTSKYRMRAEIRDIGQRRKAFSIPR